MYAREYKLQVTSEISSCPLWVSVGFLVFTEGDEAVSLLHVCHLILLQHLLYGIIFVFLSLHIFNLICFILWMLNSVQSRMVWFGTTCPNTNRHFYLCLKPMHTLVLSLILLIEMRMSLKTKCTFIQKPLIGRFAWIRVNNLNESELTHF